LTNRLWIWLCGGGLARSFEYTPGYRLYAGLSAPTTGTTC